LPRKTDSSNPADWLFIAESDLTGLQILANRQAAFAMCRSKLAEVLEIQLQQITALAKTVKARVTGQS